MKNYLKTTQLSKFALIFSMCLSLSIFGVLSVKNAAAKENPLSLADVLTGLRSKKTTLAQRNKLLTAAVKQRGVTFSLTPEIEKELKSAGASIELLDAIRQKSVKPPSPSQSAKPAGAMNSFEVEHNVFVGGKKGMLIRPDFTVLNLKNTPVQFVILIETENGKGLKAVSPKFAGTNGNLIMGSRLTPPTDAENYKNLRYFLPYEEIGLGSGNHELRMNVNLIYENGTRITQFDFYYFTFRKG